MHTQLRCTHQHASKFNCFYFSPDPPSNNQQANQEYIAMMACMTFNDDIALFVVIYILLLCLSKH